MDNGTECDDTHTSDFDIDEYIDGVLDITPEETTQYDEIANILKELVDLSGKFDDSNIEYGY